jgi:hypothetical protein
MSEDAPFTEASLTSCIRGLLTEDILSDEKQAILRDFLESDVAKSEIADVLNMRYSDLKQWHWDAGKDGIRVMPRRGLNGKYRVWADDDILQMIFVQYIGIRLCNLLKPALTTFMTFVCSRDELPSAADLDRRRFYLNQPITSSPTIEDPTTLTSSSSRSCLQPRPRSSTAATVTTTTIISPSTATTRMRLPRRRSGLESSSSSCATLLQR